MFAGVIFPARTSSDSTNVPNASLIPRHAVRRRMTGPLKRHAANAKKDNHLYFEEVGMEKKGKSLVRRLWVCGHPGCGVACCCKIPRLHPSHVFWCDDPCKFAQTDNCTQLRGYSGDPDNPYKQEVLPGQDPPFIIEKGRCLEHYEE